MVQVCSKCSRANPKDACYCYHDGFVLDHGARHGGPLAIGAQVFQQPFVFSDGRMCRSFDELALACQERWSAARDLLTQGYLEGFFGGIGRIDLVMAAREASKFPDHDRGLDQLLAKLPTDVLGSPHLAVETTEINLGQVKVGEAREFEIHLENQGMRLLYGSVTCANAKNVWLTLGDVPGTTEKHFQFGHDQVIKVKVCGDRLRANNKPLEARLLIDSNGGQATVTIKAQVPVIPFADGVLAGSRSPRELAAKAKKETRDAAPFFENGSVEEWYRVNGWTYPVTGPVYSGLHAIQQFFEALGLVKAPVVEINQQSVSLEGIPGEALGFEIKVESAEKKPVYAHALSDKPWLQPGKAKLVGRVALIPVRVASVPAQPGRTLTACLTVQSNGNQRFEVPVTLAVTGNAFAFGEEPELEPSTVAVPAGNPLELMAAQPNPLELLTNPAGAVAVAPRESAQGLSATATVTSPSLVTAPAEQSIALPLPRRGRKRSIQGAESPTPWWVHLVPAVLLACAVLGVMLFDILKPLRSEIGIDDPNGFVGGSGDTRLILTLDEDRHGSFGLQVAKEPDPTNPDKLKRITFDEKGSGDNIVVKIDGFEYFFAQSAKDRQRTITKLPNGRIGQVDTLFFKLFKVEVEQRVELVKGATGQYDTCLIEFTITNKDPANPHEVGLRVLMDTYIGANDGVPFTVPGRKGFVNTMEEFRETQIPDYIEAIEKPDSPSDLGTIVRMGLKHLQVAGPALEPIERMRICHYPGSQTKWDWDMEPMDRGSKKDSCVALFWANQKMNPDDSRHLAYTYGLSELSIGTGESPIALSAPPYVRPGSEFVVTGYVWNARGGSKVELELPEGLELARDEVAEKTIEDGSGGRVQVSWRVRTGKEGVYDVKAKMGRNASRPLKVRVETRLF